MAKVDDRVSVTLPRELLERVSDLARQDNATLERELENLVDSGIRRRQRATNSLLELSEAVRARLNREGKLGQTSEQVLEDLRRIREEVADELYPD
jgi:hypothetical protein